MPSCPNSLCDPSLGQKSMYQTGAAELCTACEICYSKEFHQTVFIARSKKLEESGIVLISAHEVYKKMQFVEDAGR